MLVVGTHRGVGDIVATRNATELVALCRQALVIGSSEDRLEDQRTEDTSPSVVSNQRALLENNGGRVDDVGPLLDEERILLAAVEGGRRQLKESVREGEEGVLVGRDAVESGRTEHADVKVGVAEPVRTRRVSETPTQTATTTHH